MRGAGRWQTLHLHILLGGDVVIAVDAIFGLPSQGRGDIENAVGDLGASQTR